MKCLRKLCAVVALTFVFSLTAFAGDMSCGVTSSPPPQQPQAMTAGDINCGISATDDTTGSETVVSPVTEIALGLIQNVLAIF